jgi:hypothetical protein
MFKIGHDSTEQEVCHGGTFCARSAKPRDSGRISGYLGSATNRIVKLLPILMARKSSAEEGLLEVKLTRLHDGRPRRRDGDAAARAFYLVTMNCPMISRSIPVP